MADEITKVDDSTIKITTTSEATVSIPTLLARRQAQADTLVRFDAQLIVANQRYVVERAKIVSKLEDLDLRITQAQAAGIVLPE